VLSAYFLVPSVLGTRPGSARSGSEAPVKVSKIVLLIRFNDCLRRSIAKLSMARSITAFVQSVGFFLLFLRFERVRLLADDGTT
jgi:hypothetical protein